jgi:hypothetical protein
MVQRSIFGGKLMEIEFNQENIEKCLCSKCKVHNKSQCVKNKEIKLQEKALSAALIRPEEFPALYCASGKEHCSDLDSNEACLCPDCTIYAANDMGTGSPDSYFCLNGQSTRCSYCEMEEEDYRHVTSLIKDFYTRID